MSAPALALNQKLGFMVGAPERAAGEDGARIAQLLHDALVAIKGTSSARWSSPFSELRALETPRREMINVAEKFLFLLPSHLPVPELGLDNEGDIVFDWEGPRGQLCTVALAHDGRLSYACRASDDDKEHGTKRFFDAIPRVVLECIERTIAA